MKNNWIRGLDEGTLCLNANCEDLNRKTELGRLKAQ